MSKSSKFRVRTISDIPSIHDNSLPTAEPVIHDNSLPTAEPGNLERSTSNTSTISLSTRTSSPTFASITPITRDTQSENEMRKMQRESRQAYIESTFKKTPKEEREAAALANFF